VSENRGEVKGGTTQQEKTESRGMGGEGRGAQSIEEEKDKGKFATAVRHSLKRVKGGKVTMA